MTAATRTPADVVHQAHALFHEAMASEQRAAFECETLALAFALADIADLDPGALGWGWTWPRLNDADDRALLAAAEKAETAAGALIAAMRAAGITGTDINDMNETTGVAS